MTNFKNMGKRPIIDDKNGPYIKRKSTASGTPEPSSCALINDLRSESQKRKQMSNATKVDVKVKMKQSQGLVDKASDERNLASTKHLNKRSMTKRCQSSNSKNGCLSFVCEICFESKTANKSFSIQGCSHAYCTYCIVKYVVSKLQENITSIPCPVGDCKGLLKLEYCRKILPEDVVDRWGIALCEAVIRGAQKFYCPYKDCSALMIDDGGEIIRESECPHCNRLFCAQCKVPWHAEVDCVGFQKLNKYERDREDIMLMKLAQNKNWKRCPSCRYYVEKKDGCMYVKCRCGFAFCYNCGARLNTTTHLCPECLH